MSRRLGKFRASVALSLATAPIAALAAPPEFRGLGELAGGSVRSTATAVSADGSVVAGYSESENGTEAFRWSLKTGMYGLGTLGGSPFMSNGRAISADGTLIFGDSVAFDLDPNTVAVEAFRWTKSAISPDGFMESLGDLPGSIAFAHCNGCSADGSVAVGSGTSEASGSGSSEAFRIVGANPIEPLGDLPGGSFFSVATGVSADGSVVCGHSSSVLSGPSSAEMFRWTESDGMEALGDLPGGASNSCALAISADGATIVGYGSDSEGVQAVRWTAQTGIELLGDLPGGFVSARANGVSGDGSVIVGQGHSESGFRAFIWTADLGIRSLRLALQNQYGLDLTNWRLDTATAVSNDGLTIVGWGLNPSGEFEAWRAYLGDPCVLVGDLNSDGTVNVADLAILMFHFGIPGVDPEDGDLNGDGIVNISDLSLLLGNFGATCP